MGCENCANNKLNGKPTGCRNNGLCSSGGCSRLAVVNWLAGMQLPEGREQFDCVEVRFKNGRKDIYRNENRLELHEGDVIAVEAPPGHDIGIVTLTGDLVKVQMDKININYDSTNIKKIYRLAGQNDIDKWQYTRSLEESTMKKARTIAMELGLKMKISDVEYQGDNSKAFFYYTSDERVDFRELIKHYAKAFKLRIEMKQIGMRQEAQKLGGIGSCGRELCCSTWLRDFRSVSTSAARYQQLSLNPSKLAGQCGKLKCCLNYELDGYVEELQLFPDVDIKLETKAGKAFFQKMDIFKNIMWYSYENNKSEFILLPLQRVKQIIEFNEAGKKPDQLSNTKNFKTKKDNSEYQHVLGQDSLTRFDGKKSNKNRRGKKTNKR